MKKSYVSILFFLATLLPLNADSILEKLANTKFDVIIRPDNSNDYVCTFFWDLDSVQIMYESDAGSSPTLLGYRLSEDRITFLIKSDWVFSDGYLENSNRNTWYYLVEMTIAEGKPKFSCRGIDSIDLSAFKLNAANVSDDNVNVRDAAALTGKKIGQKNKGDSVKVSGASKKQEKVGQYQDYWYSFDYKGRTGWIFGSFIRFGKVLKPS